MTRLPWVTQFTLVMARDGKEFTASFTKTRGAGQYHNRETIETGIRCAFRYPACSRPVRVIRGLRPLQRAQNYNPFNQRDDQYRLFGSESGPRKRTKSRARNSRGRRNWFSQEADYAG